MERYVQTITFLSWPQRDTCSMYRLIIHSTLTFQRSGSVKPRYSMCNNASTVGFNAVSPICPGGASWAVSYIYPSVPLPGTSCLTFPIQRGFTVSVGAIARQWVRRAAICQCLAASRKAEGCTRFLRKGDSLPDEREGERESLICAPVDGATRWVRERRYYRAAETEIC